MKYNIFWIAFVIIVLLFALSTLKYWYNTIEVIFAMIILSVSKNSLKKSVIRKWRESFYILFFTSLAAIAHGLLTIGQVIPDFLNNIMFLFFTGVLVFCIFNLSIMNGLKV